MVLVDTSAWIQHFKSQTSHLKYILREETVVTHEFILGELSLGQFKQKDRLQIFERIEALPRLATSNHSDIIRFVQSEKIHGKGIGWIDCHLIHACIKNNIRLFTLDSHLLKIAKKAKRHNTVRSLHLSQNFTKGI